MPEHWKQFSLYPPGCRNQRQPLQVFYLFLPQWLEGNPIKRWHVLFEPSALIRFYAEEDRYDKILASASYIAKHCGLEFERGDCSDNPELLWPGEDYYGEEKHYGAELWEAMLNFLQGCGESSIQIAKLDHGEQPAMLRKYYHLLGNVMGLNYLEEAAVARQWSERALGNYEKYGRS